MAVGTRFSYARTVVAAVVLALASAWLEPVAPAAAQSDACPDGEVPPSGFDDVGGNVHEDAIGCVVWHGIARGVSDSQYAPSRGVRRDQLASFVARLLLAAEFDLGAPTDQGFGDVDGNVHADAINQLAEHGVVLGTGPATYAPDEIVRRDQMATFLVRAAELVAQEELSVSPASFTDIAGNTHEQSIVKAATNGLARGTTATTYRPRNEVRRDQMASFLANTLALLGVRPPGAVTEDYQIQVLYVVPSDGEDRGFATDGTIGSAVDNVNDWLAAETGGSRLRVTTVDGGLDIVFHRLERTEADLAAEGDVVVEAIAEELAGAGFDEPHKLYAIYYDGVVDGNECGGSAAWPPQVPGRFGAVYIKDCADGDGVGHPNQDMGMIHEIMHMLGMVPAGDANDGSPCAPNQVDHGDGHVNDDPQDLMYQGPEGWDVDNMRLDVGADDYAYTPYRTGCPNLLYSAFLDPLPELNFLPPGW